MRFYVPFPQNFFNVTKTGAAAVKRRRLGDLASISVQVQHTVPLGAPMSFFKTVSEDCCWNCIAKFIDGTGCNATAGSVCVICVGSFFHSEIEHVPISVLFGDLLTIEDGTTIVAVTTLTFTLPMMP
jgi:hypothetical protein